MKIAFEFLRFVAVTAITLVRKKRANLLLKKLDLRSSGLRRNRLLSGCHRPSQAEVNAREDATAGQRELNAAPRADWGREGFEGRHRVTRQSHMAALLWIKCGARGAATQSPALAGYPVATSWTTEVADSFRPRPAIRVSLERLFFLNGRKLVEARQISSFR